MAQKRNRTNSPAKSPNAAAAGGLPTPVRRPAERRIWLPLAIAVLATSAVLIFYDLGHYPLWEDEADTALFARAVARTGDTIAVLDHNIMAIRSGSQLTNLRERYEPPLPFYFAAPFVGREGTGSFWPRLPFAVSGLLTIAFIVYWLWRDGADAKLWSLFSLGIVTNVSLMLFFRQCRYYALATLLTVAAAYCYLHWDGRRRWLVWFCVLSVLLLLTNYIAYVGLFAAVGLDYLLFQRRRQRINWRELAAVMAPQIAVGIFLLATRNPYNKEVIKPVPGSNWLLDKLTLVWWNFRDLNACEFGVGLLMLAAPLLYLRVKNPWLLRAPLAIAAYAVAVAMVSPEAVGAMNVAEIRYLSALIPLCIFLTALVILSLSGKHLAIALPLAALAFGTNLLHLPFEPNRWQSTTYKWVKELYTARTTVTQLAVDWINSHMQPGQSLWVVLDSKVYPLMYHAPQVQYAWQLRPPPAGQFKDLPPIHFFGVLAPDYIMTFGAHRIVAQYLNAFQAKQIEYDLVQKLDMYCFDDTRPELFWRHFEPRTNVNPAYELVYIFQRKK